MPKSYILVSADQTIYSISYSGSSTYTASGKRQMSLNMYWLKQGDKHSIAGYKSLWVL